MSAVYPHGGGKGRSVHRVMGDTVRWRVTGAVLDWRHINITRTDIIMPYYVFRVSSDRKTLSCLNVHEKYRAARDQCRQLRETQATEDDSTVRLIHADDERQAKVLLAEKNKPSSPLEEWEG